MEGCRGVGDNSGVKIDRTRAGADIDVNVIDRGGTADVRVRRARVLVEPEECHTLYTVDGVERSGIGIPCSVKTGECNCVEVVDIAPR